MFSLQTKSRDSALSCLQVCKIARLMVRADRYDLLLFGSWGRILREELLVDCADVDAKSAICLVWERNRLRRIMVRIS